VTHGFTFFTVFQVSKFMPMAQDALAVELLSCRFLISRFSLVKT
jgi:hypothetical protein